MTTKLVFNMSFLEADVRARLERMRHHVLQSPHIEAGEKAGIIDTINGELAKLPKSCPSVN